MCLLWSSKLQLSHHVSTRAHRRCKGERLVWRNSRSAGTLTQATRADQSQQRRHGKGRSNIKKLTSALRQLSIQKFSLRLKGVKILFFLNFHKGLQILFFGSLCQCVQIGQVCLWCVIRFKESSVLFVCSLIVQLSFFRLWSVFHADRNLFFEK